MRRRLYIIFDNLRPLLTAFFISLWPVASYAGVPIVKDLTITDVTTRSFAVVWQASEASLASLQVFEDAAGTVPISSAVVTPHPVDSGDETIRTAAQDRGVMKVQVTGLQPDTDYFFKTVTTSKSSTEQTITPTTPHLVHTEVHTVRSKTVGVTKVPFSNDLLIFPSVFPDGMSPAIGGLVIVSVLGGHYPITSFIGDGIPAPSALVDMNNFFDATTQENMNLHGNELLSIWEMRGLCSGVLGPLLTHLRRVPTDSELSAISNPAPCFSPKNIAADFNCDQRISGGDFNLFLANFRLEVGDCAFNADFDLNADQQVSGGDFNLFLSVFGAAQ